MYYYCTKLNAFQIPNLSERYPGGGVIAASAVPYPQLARRSFMTYPHLQHRLLDPQLYLANLDPRTAAGTVYKLATYPWFGASPPTFDSAVHRTFMNYKTQTMQGVIARWPGAAPTTEAEVRECVRTSLEVQLRLGCEGLIIPSPLTLANRDYALETVYLNAASDALARLQPSVPTYATVAISDGLLRGIDPTTDPLLRTITDQIAARAELAGAYIVLEQTAETGYVCVNENSLFALLLLIDDLVRGAGKRVMVNYVGAFGAAAAAAGAAVWTSGYYRSQRRMRLADQEEDVGRSYPRFFSSQLAGDIGIDPTLLQISRTPIFHRVFTSTQASRSLFSALQAGTYPAAAPQWEYRPSNISAAAAHYNDACCKLEAFFDSQDRQGRIEATDRWLKQAQQLAEGLVGLGVDPARSDVRHQAIWQTAFQRWRTYSGQ